MLPGRPHRSTLVEPIAGVQLPEYHDRVEFALGDLELSYYVSTVERDEVGPGIADGYYTRLLARIAHDAPPFHIFPVDLFARVTKLFGAQDLETDDPAYDAAFVIRCERPRWLLPRLTEPFRRRHLAHPDTLVRHLDGRFEALYHRGLDTVEGIVERAEALAELHRQL